MQKFANSRCITEIDRAVQTTIEEVLRAQNESSVAREVLMDTVLNPEDDDEFFAPK